MAENAGSLIVLMIWFGVFVLLSSSASWLTTSMSEKPEHGGEMLKTFPAMSEKPLSEKAISEKLEHQNPGQPNIKNKSIKKQFYGKGTGI